MSSRRVRATEPWRAVPAFILATGLGAWLARCSSAWVQHLCHAWVPSPRDRLLSAGLGTSVQASCGLCGCQQVLAGRGPQ